MHTGETRTSLRPNHHHLNSPDITSESRKVKVVFFYKMSFADLYQQAAELKPHILELTISKVGGNVNDVFQQVARLTNTKVNFEILCIYCHSEFQTEELKLYEAYKNRIRTIYESHDILDGIRFNHRIVVCQVATDNDEQLKTIGKFNLLIQIMIVI